MLKILQKKIETLEILLSHSDKRCLFLQNTIEVYKKENVALKEATSKRSFTIPFIKETKEALHEAGKEIVDAPVTFSISEWDVATTYESGTSVMFNGEKLYAFEVGCEPSRFIPNVKFILTGVKFLKLFPKETEVDELVFCHTMDGYFFLLSSIETFNECEFSHVDYHDACPELVPEVWFATK